MYNVSWIERQIASRLFGKPPTSTIEEAETAFEKVSTDLKNLVQYLLAFNFRLIKLFHLFD